MLSAFMVFHKRYECFETFQEILSGFAIYGECIRVSVGIVGQMVL